MGLYFWKGIEYSYPIVSSFMKYSSLLTWSDTIVGTIFSVIIQRFHSSQLQLKAIRIVKLLNIDYFEIYLKVLSVKFEGSKE